MNVMRVSINISEWALAALLLACGLILQLQKRYRLRIEKSKRRLSWADETHNISNDAIGRVSLLDFRKECLDQNWLRNYFYRQRKPVIHVMNRLAPLFGGLGFFVVGEISTARRVHLVANRGRRLQVRSAWHTTRSQIWSSFKRILSDEWIPFRIVPVARRGFSLDMLEEMKVLACLFIFQVKFNLPITMSAARRLVPMIDEYCDQLKPLTFGEESKISTCGLQDIVAFCKVTRAKHLNDGESMMFCESNNGIIIKVKPHQMAMYLVQAVPKMGSILTDALRHLSENIAVQDDLRMALRQSDMKSEDSASISQSVAEQEFVHSFFPGFRDTVQAPLMGLPCRLLASVVREVLRLQDNVPSSRFTLGEKRVRVAGLSSHVVIPRYSTAFIYPEAILRNSDVFDHPNTFDPSRWGSPSKYMVQSMCTLSLNDPNEVVQDCTILLEAFLATVIPEYAFYLPEESRVSKTGGHSIHSKSSRIIVWSSKTPHTPFARRSQSSPPPILLDRRSSRRKLDGSDVSCFRLF